MKAGALMGKNEAKSLPEKWEMSEKWLKSRQESCVDWIMCAGLLTGLSADWLTTLTGLFVDWLIRSAGVGAGEGRGTHGQERGSNM